MRIACLAVFGLVALACSGHGAAVESKGCLVLPNSIVDSEELALAIADGVAVYRYDDQKTSYEALLTGLQPSLPSGRWHEVVVLSMAPGMVRTALAQGHEAPPAEPLVEDTTEVLARTRIVSR